MDPFGDETLQMGYDSKAGFGSSLTKPEYDILYGASFSMGPDRVAGDWVMGARQSMGPNRGAASTLAYSSTNGVRSRGEMWVIVPNPSDATSTAIHLRNIGVSWEEHFGSLRSFDSSED